MTVLKKITNEFEGENITTLTYNGRPAWIAKDIGRILGYAQNGRRLVGNISEKWSEEFILNHDYVTITGEELKSFKEVVEVDTESVSAFSSHLLLLFEPGLHLCLAKTNKPIGRRLRRFLADEVMPQLARDGRYSPDREVVDDEVVEKEVAEAIREESPALNREKRLAKHMKAKALKDLAKLLRRSQRITPAVADYYEIEAFEVLTDKDFSDLKPANRGFWKGVSEIAYDLKETIWEVEKATYRLGIRGNFPGIAKEIELSEIKDGKPVKAYLFSPKGEEMIRRFIGSGRPCYSPQKEEADYDL
jgi:prophage antirepressor-like protein